ncbi:HPP family protein [Aestuariivirga litoralis]|nr:HPP family protein [Aestuariivirga litoralis]
MAEPKQFKFFSPILAGASLDERLWACFGALLAICVTGSISAFLLGHGFLLPLIVAPIGASAVLVFAVPASPLAQPWPVIGGNTISALVGVATVQLVPDPLYATGIAVCLAILAMSFTRSLHPPGGAAALTAVIGGAAIRDGGFVFPFVPVALNSIILVGLGFMFHKFSQHSYPHKPVKAPTPSLGFTSQDIDGALADMHETFDIDRGDLEALLRLIEQRAAQRTTK